MSTAQIAATVSSKTLACFCAVRDAMDELDRQLSDVESRTPALEGRGVCAPVCPWKEARACRMFWAVWRAVSWRGLSAPRPSLRKYAKLWVEKSMKATAKAQNLSNGRSRRLRPVDGLVERVTASGNAFNIRLAQGEPTEPLRNRAINYTSKKENEKNTKTLDYINSKRYNTM